MKKEIKILFKDNAEVADRLGMKNKLSVSEFVFRNIYNRETIKYCFAKYSPLSEKQKQELKQFLLNYKKGQNPSYAWDNSLEKWVIELQSKGVL